MGFAVNGIKKIFYLGFFILFLAGCGGGDDDGNASHLFPDDEESIPVESVELLTSSPQLPSSATEAVTLTAVIKDNNNVLREGVNVTFSADNDGSIQIVRGTTDATGTAEGILSTTGNKNNRTINVSASADGISDSTSVQVLGTRIDVSGPDSVALGNPVELTLTLQDSAGAGISGQTLSISSALGNTIGNPSPTTDTRGQAIVTIIPVVSGADTITASAPGATGGVHTLNVSTDSFMFTSPSPSLASVQEIPVNLDFSVTVRWENSGVPITGQPVNFFATRGNLSANNVLTDADGEATVTIRSDNIGPSLITASAVGGPSIQIEIIFVATAAARIDLQANPSVIGTNPSGGDAERSTITAVVRDPNNHLVKGKTVNFTLTDITGGSIFPPSAVTDAFGQANTVYTAGTTSSALNGVTINAQVTGTDLNATVNLTTAKKELFVTLGTGNEISEPNATTYAAPFSVLVTDAAGGPIANAQVNLTIFPLSYRKGFYVFVDPVWVPVFTLDTAKSDGGVCNNEDRNRNGILDTPPDFDRNGNGVLDPGNLVTISSTTAVTDASGFAFFDLRYAQQFANWIDVRLTATARVAGSEATEIAEFALPGAASDFNSEDVNPPGNPSPFGVSDTCADTN